MSREIFEILTLGVDVKPKKPIGKAKKGDRWGHSRKAPAPGDFEFIEINGVKVLKHQSNETATWVRHELPVLELEVHQFMTYSQRLSAVNSGKIPPWTTVRAKFPMLDRFCDESKILEISGAGAGMKSPRKEAVAIMAEKLQMPPETIERYSRQLSVKKKPSPK
jgi:hypothetical protein